MAGRKRSEQDRVIGVAPRPGGPPARVAVTSSSVTDAAAADGGPVAVVISDAVVLHRRLDLPEADDATLRRMATAQLQGLLPGRSSLLRVGCERSGEVVQAIAARDAAVSAAMTLLTGVVAVVPASIAAFAAAQRAGVAGGRCAVVSVEPDVTAVVTAKDDRIERIDVVDVGAADLSDATGRRRWLTELIDLVDADRAVIVGDLSAELEEALGDAVQASVMGVAAVARALGVAAEAATIRAAGAADAAMDRRGPLFDVAAEAAALTTRSPWRQWAPVGVAAAWLLLALVLLVVTDLGRASQWAAAADEADLEGPAIAQLDRQLVLLRQLESRGPLPLAILDEVTAATPSGLQYSEFRYGSDGAVTLAGEVQQEQQLGQLLQALTASRTLASVELRSQKKQDRKVVFEIAAQVSPLFTGAYVEPAKDEAKTPEQG